MTVVTTVFAFSQYPYFGPHTTWEHGPFWSTGKEPSRPAYRTCGERVAPAARLLLPGAQEGTTTHCVSVWLAGSSARGVDLEDSDQ